MQTQKMQMQTKFSTAQFLLHYTVTPSFAPTVEVRQVKETVTFKKALCPGSLKSFQQPK
jgi:hypothetical protein